MDSAFASSLMFHGHAHLYIESALRLPYLQTAGGIAQRLVLAALLGAMLGHERRHPANVRSHALTALAAAAYISTLTQAGIQAAAMLQHLIETATWMLPVLFLIAVLLVRERTLRITSVFRFGMAVIVGGIAGFGALTDAVFAAIAGLMLLAMLLRLEAPKD